MAHILETKHLQCIREAQTLVINQDSCVVQTTIGDAVLKEWIIPLVYRSPDIPEVSVEIPKEIVNNNDVILIDKTHIHTSSVSYPYKQGEVMIWNTGLPSVAAVFQVPTTTDKISGLSELSVNNRQLHIKTEESLVFHYNLLHTIKETSEVYIDGSIIYTIFKDHIGELCKLYMDTDSPVCLEFTSTFELKTIYYVAPCYTPDSK